MSECEWQILNRHKWRYNQQLLAFHEVKCGNEHRGKKTLREYDSTKEKISMHYFCTIFCAVSAEAKFL